MENFYFTYGSGDDMPFRGGWTVIQAPDLDSAIEIFRNIHPNQDGSNLLNCASFYTEEAFKRTSMYNNGNFGKFCVEKILQNEEAPDEQT